MLGFFVCLFACISVFIWRSIKICSNYLNKAFRFLLTWKFCEQTPNIPKAYLSINIRQMFPRLRCWRVTAVPGTVRTAQLLRWDYGRSVIEFFCPVFYKILIETTRRSDTYLYSSNSRSFRGFARSPSTLYDNSDRVIDFITGKSKTVARKRRSSSRELTRSFF